MKIAIYSRGLDLATPNPLALLLEALAPHDVEIHVFQQLLLHADLPADTTASLIPFKVSSDLDATIDCPISLGGDGTMLDAVTLVKDSGIPILGINFGRLGFLASISPDALQSAVEAIVNRTFVVDKRALIHLDSNEGLFGDTPFALNEIAIHKRDISPMIKIHTYINGEILNTN